MKTSDPTDRKFMRRALDLAARATGATRPNPPVGAVLVKNGRIIGEGFHERAGKAHAESAVIQAAGRNARGADLYVTLEPCSTMGRTGACTDHILDAGIRRVIIAVTDPNPAHAGRGIRLLRNKGLTVDTGCESERADKLIAPFTHWIIHGTPRLTLKLAISMDGKIADHAGRSRWISSPASRKRVQQLRREADAIMIGAETARMDRPRLLPLNAGHNRPWRVIVDSRGSIDLDAPVFCDRNRAQTILATTNACREDVRRKLEKQAVTVWTLPSKAGRVSLRTLVRRLGRLHVMQVLCEGGGELAASLVSEGLVNEYYFFVAPKLIGGKLAPGAVGGKGFALAGAPELDVAAIERSGNDILIRAFPAHPPRKPPAGKTNRARALP